MTIEEYKAQLKVLEKEHWDKRVELANAYAMSNNPYRVGDILQDHCQIIRVESIKFACNTYDTPQCVYYGTQLTKKLEPKKKQDITPRIYQTNVKRKLN